MPRAVQIEQVGPDGSVREAAGGILRLAEQGRLAKNPSLESSGRGTGGYLGLEEINFKRKG